MSYSEDRSPSRSGGLSPAHIAFGLIAVIVLAAVATLALTGGSKKAEKQATPSTNVDPFEGLGPDPLREKTPQR